MLLQTTKRREFGVHVVGMRARSEFIESVVNLRQAKVTGGALMRWLPHMIRPIQAAGVLGLGVLAGCATLMRPSPYAPFLHADATDAPLIEALAHEQFSRVESCPTRNSCPQDHYTQGLIALFQSRERAVASFQQVISEAPNTHLATRSTSWIEVMQTSAGVPKVTEDFIWETLERELDGANERVRTLFSDRAKRVGEMPDRPLMTRQEPTPEPKDKDLAMLEKDKNQATIHALQKRLRERERSLTERDRQIAIMASQLDAMKRIDQDSRDRQRQPKRPATVVAPEGEEEQIALDPISLWCRSHRHDENFGTRY